MTKQEAIDKALAYFKEGYACSQSVAMTFAPEFGTDVDTVKMISAPFGGGMGRLRGKCGAVTGAFMVLGMATGKYAPKDMDTKLAQYKKVQDMNAAIVNIYGTAECGELLAKKVNKEQVEARDHHQIVCTGIIADAVAALYDILYPEKQALVQ